MKQFILAFLSILILSFSLNAQTWSSSPAVNTYANCGNSGTVTCGFGNVLGNGIIRARVTSLNSTSATIQMSRCFGTFSSSGTMYVKTSICQTTGLASVAYSAGSSSASGTFNNSIAVDKLFLIDRSHASNISLINILNYTKNSVLFLNDELFEVGIILKKGVEPKNTQLKSKLLLFVC